MSTQAFLTHLRGGAWLRVVLLGLMACGATPKPLRGPKVAAGAFTVSLIGTNDLHGAIEQLPLFGGYVANLRQVRASDKGAVVMIDAGDMFQGTLESNVREGEDVVAMYNQLGYAAAAIGNHEFDFGPAGPAASPRHPGDDPQGALKARAAQAEFPFLMSNVAVAGTLALPAWPNVLPTTMLTLAREDDLPPVKLGIVGATTESTPHTTFPANFGGLRMLNVAQAVALHARQLRAQGASVIIATMHVGSACKKFGDPNDLSSCKQDEELFQVIGALPEGLVDVIVAGHTHAAIAHRIRDVAVIESYASGRAFGRVDLRLDAQGRVTGIKLFPPEELCVLAKGEPCPVATYEGRPVTPDATLAAMYAAADARIKATREASLNTTVADEIWRAYDRESPLGNLFADLLLAAVPTAHLGLANGGGLRANLLPGPLTYGALFRANPFDNRLATIELTGKQVLALVASNLHRGAGIHSWAGLRIELDAEACAKGVETIRAWVGEQPLVETQRYLVATSDYLASGGDGALARLGLAPEATKVTDIVIRDAMADVLKARGGTLRSQALFRGDARRLRYPGRRPVQCPPANGADEPGHPPEARGTH